MAKKYELKKYNPIIRMEVSVNIDQCNDLCYDWVKIWNSNQFKCNLKISFQTSCIEVQTTTTVPNPLCRIDSQ